MDELAIRVTECAKSAGGAVWVASSDHNGVPHLALSDRLEMPDDRTARLTGWCCVKTIDNARQNPSLSVGVWDCTSNQGWQLVGKVTGIDVAEAAKPAASGPVTVEYTVTMTVDEALHLTPGRHSDSAM